MEKFPADNLEIQFRDFVLIVNGKKCGTSSIDSNLQMLKSIHPNRSIEVDMTVTSDRVDDATGKPINYPVQKTVGPMSEIELGCARPGPTTQKFIWHIDTARWA